DLIAVDRVIVRNEEHAGPLGSVDDRLERGRADCIDQDHVVASVDEVINCPYLRRNIGTGTDDFQFFNQRFDLRILGVGLEAFDHLDAPGITDVTVGQGNPVRRFLGFKLQHFCLRGKRFETIGGGSIRGLDRSAELSQSDNADHGSDRNSLVHNIWGLTGGIKRREPRRLPASAKNAKRLLTPTQGGKRRAACWGKKSIHSMARLCDGNPVMNSVVLEEQRAEFKAINPSTGEIVKTYEGHTQQEVNAILQTVSEAFGQWRWTDFETRADLMRQAAKVL